MKRYIVRILLAMLNSHFLNASPCKYAFVGNVHDFSREHLEAVHRMGHTIPQLLKSVDDFRACKFQSSGGIHVIDEHGTRSGTEADIQDFLGSFDSAAEPTSVAPEPYQELIAAVKDCMKIWGIADRGGMADECSTCGEDHFVKGEYRAVIVHHENCQLGKLEKAMERCAAGGPREGEK